MDIIVIELHIDIVIIHTIKHVTGVDSGMVWNWQGRIGAGQTITKQVTIDIH